jgi:26S proteasome regulatory subunit N8
VLVIVDVRLECVGLPITCYKSIDKVIEGKDAGKDWVHITSEIGAYEAEEVGVEHLLRDINDPTVGNLAENINDKLQSMSILSDKLSFISDYLQDVNSQYNTNPQGFKLDHEVLENIQSIMSLLPNTTEMVSAIAMNGNVGEFEQMNDQHFSIYIGALIRAVLALHDVTNNRIQYKEDEEDGVKVKETAPVSVSAGI